MVTSKVVGKSPAAEQARSDEAGGFEMVRVGLVTERQSTSVDSGPWPADGQHGAVEHLTSSSSSQIE
jgi:hypothetical protein